MHPLSRFAIFLKRIDILLETIVILVLTLLLVITGISAFITLGIVLKLNQQVAVISAKVFRRGQLVKLLSPMSSIAANIDHVYKKPRLAIVAALVLEGIPDMQRVRETAKLQILEKVDPKTGKWMYPELFQNISYWMGYPFWRKLGPGKTNSEWFLNQCVRFHENDENMESNFDILDKLLRQLCFTPFSKQKPLVEIIILPNYTPHPEKNAGLSPDGKYFCSIVRIHHALADASTLFRLLQNLNTTADDLVQVEDIQAHDYSHQRKLKGRSFFMKLLKSLGLIPQMMYELAQSAVFVGVNCSSGSTWPKRRVSTNFKSEKPMSDTEQNLKGLRNFKSAHGKPFSMTEINEIKQIHGVSGTAVLLSAMIGATRNTLFNCDDIFPPYIGYVFPLPISGHNGVLDNRFTLALVQIALGESDPVRRLHKTNQSMQKLKKSTLPAALAILGVTLFGPLPRWMFHLGFDYLSQTVENLVSSNIAGPNNMVDVAGYPVRDIFGAMGIASERKMVLLVMVSIVGRARLIVMSDSAIIGSDEQAEVLADNFFAELETLRRDKGYVQPDTN